MDDFTRQVADNTRDLNTTQRRAFNVRINGEEHSARARGGVANIYFPIDGQLMQVSELAFKLIVNNGSPSGGGWTDAEIGIDKYPTLASWEARWPLGSEIDVDGAWGCQSLVPGTCLLGTDNRYIPVEELLPGDKVFDKSGKIKNTVSDNNATEEELIEVRTGSGWIRGTLGHRVFVGGKEKKLVDLQHGDLIDMPEVPKTDLGLDSDQYKMLGFWLGDGYINFKKTCAGNTTLNTIAVVVGTKKKEQFLRSLSVDLSWSKHSNGKHKVARILSTPRNARLREVIVKYHDKRIPILGEGAEEVINGYACADGHWRRPTQNIITSTNRPLLCAIQEMAFSLGYHATLGKLTKRRATNFCSSPKPLSSLTINFNPVKPLKRNKVIQVNRIKRGLVYHTNVRNSNHSYIAEGLCHHNCVDYINAFFLAQVGRRVVTGPNLYAYEIWTESRDVNAGTEFDLIYNWADLKPGDWVIWRSPTTGHVGMVVKIDDEGVHFWSQNYRNPSDQGSPLSEDIIGENTGYFNFLGAFRYKAWE